jgi:hypothetical protein
MEEIPLCSSAAPGALSRKTRDVNQRSGSLSEKILGQELHAAGDSPRCIFFALYFLQRSETAMSRDELCLFRRRDAPEHCVAMGEAPEPGDDVAMQHGVLRELRIAHRFHQRHATFLKS